MSGQLFFKYLSKLVFHFNCININILEMPFYAVAKGRTPGIFMTWPDCEAQVKGFSGARYKKFDTVDDAQNFITTVGGSISKPQTVTAKKDAIKPSPLYNGSIKRHASTSKQHEVTVAKKPKPTKKKMLTPHNTDEEDGFSDDSDDLNTIIIKQMDDVEKRLKGFEKGIDKIIKNNTSKPPQRSTVLIDPPTVKKPNVNQDGFEIDDDGFVQVYTDGACSANGQRGARAGLGVYWADNHPLNTSEPVSGRATNNCGEIQAATWAIKQAIKNGITKLSINTDSQFLINSVTKWMPGWKRKGWKLKSGEPVRNETDFKELDSLQNKIAIKWNYVEAHRGIYGNEMADQLAKAGAAMYNYNT